MKKFIGIIGIFFLFIACDSNGQPKQDYEIYSNTVSTATKYLFFAEKKGSGAYKLVQGADYLSPDIISLKVGESITASFTINLINDGAEYMVGVVSVNSAGFYSGMGVAVGNVGLVPSVPGGVGFRKKL